MVQVQPSPVLGEVIFQVIPTTWGILCATLGVIGNSVSSWPLAALKQSLWLQLFSKLTESLRCAPPSLGYVACALGAFASPMRLFSLGDRFSLLPFLQS